jgi:hypothetical protein
MKRVLLCLLLCLPLLADESIDKSVNASDVFVWFDEGAPTPGMQFMDVVVTALAYDNYLNILRMARGRDTSVKWGTSVLDTNYHPHTFRLGDWIAEIGHVDAVPAVTFWEGEVLSDTTPVMHFYMTRKAYQSTMAIAQNYLGGQMLRGEQKKQRHRFLSALGRASLGALQGAANYYAYVRPIEEQTLAIQQASAAQNGALMNIGYQLQQLNMQVSQENTRKIINDLSRQNSQYSRLITRYRTGAWPR